MLLLLVIDLVLLPYLLDIEEVWALLCSLYRLLGSTLTVAKLLVEHFYLLMLCLGFVRAHLFIFCV